MIRHALSMAIVISAVMFALAVGGRPGAAQTSPTSGGPVDGAIIEDLVAANRILAQEGIVDAYGHVSIRHPGNPNRYLLSRSLAPVLVTAQDIVEYDLDSNAVEARGRTSVLERFIHGEVYKARPDVNAVIHTHSPTVVPFSVTQVPLRPVLHTAFFLWVGVPVWDIRDAGDPASAGMLVRNGRLGKSLAAMLGDKPQRRGRAQRADGGQICHLYRGERAPAGDRHRARGSDQLHLGGGGCRDGPDARRPRASLGAVEKEGAGKVAAAARVRCRDRLRRSGLVSWQQSSTTARSNEMNSSNCCSGRRLQASDFRLQPTAARFARYGG